MIVILTFLYILLAIFAFGVMIFIHELGHFLTARWSKVTIYEFSIGMGPAIFSWKSKKYDTKYSLRALPFGGYVSMAGEDGECDDENAFNKKPCWRRFIILAAGATMNIVLGFILILTMLTTSAITNRTDGRLGLLPSNTIYDFDEDAISNSEGGLMPGDKVVKVGNVAIHTGNELSYEIMNQGYESLELTVIRNGEKIVLDDVVFGTFTESGAVFGQLDFMVYGERFTFGSLMKHTLFNSLSTIKMVWDSLGDMLAGRYGLDAVSGPVGITNQMVETAKAGPTSFLYFVAVITMNLGVMNLLPLPALDGGRLVFVLWEMITRKKPSPKVESYIHAAGFMILMAFMVLIVFKDIIGLF